MVTRILTLVGVLLLALAVPAPAQQPAKPAPPPPEELVPRATLEKLYAAELPGYQPAQFDKVYAAHLLVEKYFLTESAEDRRTITKLLEKTAIPVHVLGRLCRLRLSWPALPEGPAYVNERHGPHDVAYFLGVPKGYDRATAWPLVIRLPAFNAIVQNPDKPPTADEVARLYTGWVADELARHPDAVVVMPLLNYDELYGPSLKGMSTVVQALHHVASRANIDPAQVYLSGHGMGGHATWNLALHFPTYFAAINPLAGAASADWQRVRLLNLRNVLPVVWHDTTDKVIPPGHATALVNILKQFKYDVVFEQTKTLGHVPSNEVAEKCYSAMRARKRALYPQQVNLRSTRPDPTFNRIDWVQVYQPLNAGTERRLLLRHGTGYVVVNDNAHSVQAALTTPNKIEAKTDNVETLRFYLNDQMMDLAKPVTVVVNGKTRYEGPVATSLDEMLKDQIFLGRGWRYFTAVLDIDLAAGSAGAASRPATTRGAPAGGAGEPGAAPAPVGLARPPGTRCFFTTDEGKTLFADDASRRPPFQHEGRLALRAHVFSADGGKTRFVGFLSKESAIAGEPLVRRPGEAQWAPVSSTLGKSIMTPKPPPPAAGKPAVEIFPEE